MHRSGVNYRGSTGVPACHFSRRLALKIYWAGCPLYINDIIKKKRRRRRREAWRYLSCIIESVMKCNVRVKLSRADFAMCVARIHAARDAGRALIVASTRDESRSESRDTRRIAAKTSEMRRRTRDWIAATLRKAAVEINFRYRCWIFIVDMGEGHCTRMFLVTKECTFSAA